MFSMKEFHVSASRAIQDHHGPLVDLHFGTDKELIDDDLRLVKKNERIRRTPTAILARKFIKPLFTSV